MHSGAHIRELEDAIKTNSPPTQQSQTQAACIIPDGGYNNIQNDRNQLISVIQNMEHQQMHSNHVLAASAQQIEILNKTLLSHISRINNITQLYWNSEAKLKASEEAQKESQEKYKRKLAEKGNEIR